jgi:exopolysaccharide biosynthesis WecB/TagA/CpsF family protein
MLFSIKDVSIEVNLPSRRAFEAKVGDCLERGAGFALATLNLDHLVKLRTDPAFRRAYARQDFITADGNPVVWLTRVSGKPVDLLPGSDMLLPMLTLAAERNVPVAFVGSTEDALSGAADTIKQELPAVEIRLMVSPSFGFDPDGTEAAEILGRIVSSGVGLCLVALGAPKQERFAALGRQIAPHVGFASIGASLDFLAGNQRRAPRWVRRISMEWLWRAAHSPRRLAKRYALCFLILPGLMISAVSQR